MSLPNSSVLVVDDDAAYRQGLCASLKTYGFAVDAARSGEEALEYIRQRPADIVLLDVSMPGMGGVGACRRIRAESPQIGIIMLTVRDAADDKVLALEAGADDYVTKPFHLRELVARIRALLRRTRTEGPALTPVLRAGNLELHLEQRILQKAGKEIHLSPKEFELLVLLMQHKNIPLLHARILRAIWGPEYGDEPDYLRSYVKTLRKKIEDDPAHPEYIQTEPWVGYRFRDPSDPDAVPASSDPQEAEDV